MNIYPTIIKSKVLTDGSHKVRIAVSHNSKTSYITTRYTIPSDSNINQRGDIVGLPNASVINMAIRKMIQEAYETCDRIPNLELLSSAQLVEIITDKGLSRPQTFDEITKIFIEHKSNSVCEGTLDIMNVSFQAFAEFKGWNYVLSLLSPTIVSAYSKFLKKQKGLADTTIFIRMRFFKSLVSFAVKRRLVVFDIDPFLDYKMPHTKVRDIDISVDDLRRIIAFRHKRKSVMEARAMFLLSFYMCGMNPVDLIKVDFSKRKVKFRRSKTDSRISRDTYTEFSIPQKALDCLKDLTMDGNYLHSSFRRKNFTDQFRFIAREVGIEKTRLKMYSARKTFAQLMAEIGYNDSVIEYCIGDVQSSKVISFYRYVNVEMADEAIEDLMRFVDSGLSTKEYRKLKR